MFERLDLGNIAFRDLLAAAPWLVYPHVVARIGNDRSNAIEEALARQGLERDLASVEQLERTRRHLDALPR